QGAPSTWTRVAALADERAELQPGRREALVADRRPVYGREQLVGHRPCLVARATVRERLQVLVILVTVADPLQPQRLHREGILPSQLRRPGVEERPIPVSVVGELLAIPGRGQTVADVEVQLAARPV